MGVWGSKATFLLDSLNSCAFSFLTRQEVDSSSDEDEADLDHGPEAGHQEETPAPGPAGEDVRMDEAGEEAAAPAAEQETHRDLQLVDIRDRVRTGVTSPDVQFSEHGGGWGMRRLAFLSYRTDPPRHFLTKKPCQMPSQTYQMQSQSRQMPF
jgi:hypothetical protein